ncbi:MAG: hypothetical protein EBQ80_06005 [Proteobacteria bacterium]|nr:hypothetical protein [Pseudomonadota bacterium]
MAWFGKSPFKVVRVGNCGYESPEYAESEVEAVGRATTRSIDGNTYAIINTSSNTEVGRYKGGKRT